MTDVLSYFRGPTGHSSWTPVPSGGARGHPDEGAAFPDGGAETPRAAPPQPRGMGRGFPLPSRLGGLGECREFPQRGPGQSPGQKRISVLSKRHRMPVVETFVVNVRRHC